MSAASVGRGLRVATLALTLAVAATVWSRVTALQSGETASFAFVHVAVIDGTGAPVRLDQTVVVSGDRITAVGPSSKMSIPRDARSVNARGRFLIPGLWDAHVHTRYEGIDHLRSLVANGITSARNMSGPSQHL